MCLSLIISCTEPVAKHIVGHTHILIRWTERLKRERGANTSHPAAQFGQDFISMYCEMLDLNFNVLKAWRQLTAFCFSSWNNPHPCATPSEERNTPTWGFILAIQVKTRAGLSWFQEPGLQFFRRPWSGQGLVLHHGCPKEADGSGGQEPELAKPEGRASHCFPGQPGQPPAFPSIDSSCVVPCWPSLLP